MDLKQLFKKSSISLLAGVSAAALFSPAVLASKRVRVHYPNHVSRVISVQNIKRVKHNHKSSRVKVAKQAQTLFKQFRKAGYSNNKSIAIVATIYREDAKFAPITHHHKSIYFGIIPVEYSAIKSYAKARHASVNNPVTQFNYLLNSRQQTRAFKRFKGNAGQLDRFIARHILKTIIIPNKEQAYKQTAYVRSLVMNKHSAKKASAKKATLSKVHQSKAKNRTVINN